MARLRIGLLGPGMIAGKAIAPAIAASQHAVLELVGSRSGRRARAFAARAGARWTAGYDAVLKDRRVDVVYIALPNALHVEWILRAVRAGKHVICEKPACVRLRHAEQIVRACRRAGVRFLEAYMFRFHPQHARVRNIVRAGTLGRVFHLQAAFGFPPLAPENVRYSRALEGGALRDAGGYPIAAARMMFEEEPSAICVAVQRQAHRAVDTRGVMQLEFPSGNTAQAAFGFEHAYRNTYALWGTKGHLVVERAFSIPRDMAASITYTTAAGARTLSASPADHFQLMIDAFCLAVRAGATAPRTFEQDCLAQSAVIEAAIASARYRRRMRVQPVRRLK